MAIFGEPLSVGMNARKESGKSKTTILTNEPIKLSPWSYIVKRVCVDIGSECITLIKGQQAMDL